MLHGHDDLHVVIDSTQLERQAVGILAFIVDISHELADHVCRGDFTCIIMPSIRWSDTFANMSITCIFAFSQFIHTLRKGCLGGIPFFSPGQNTVPGLLFCR